MPPLDSIHKENTHLDVGFQSPNLLGAAKDREGTAEFEELYTRRQAYLVSRSPRTAYSERNVPDSTVWSNACSAAAREETRTRVRCAVEVTRMMYAMQAMADATRMILAVVLVGNAAVRKDETAGSLMGDIEVRGESGGKPTATHLTRVII
ncbi:hypothetical protein B0H11DRAFT_1905499 [Mycena galericulata]|nr:hypothetical protein B0H11DRAFT_1905499 [Mycena galericulata]